MLRNLPVHQANGEPRRLLRARSRIRSHAWRLRLQTFATGGRSCKRSLGRLLGRSTHCYRISCAPTTRAIQVETKVPVASGAFIDVTFTIWRVLQAVQEHGGIAENFMQMPAYHILKVFQLLDYFDSTRTPHLLDAIKVSTDALTSLWSRGIFFQDVSEEMTRSQGTGSAQEGCTAARGIATAFGNYTNVRHYHAADIGETFFASALDRPIDSYPDVPAEECPVWTRNSERVESRECSE